MEITSCNARMTGTTGAITIHNTNFMVSLKPQVYFLNNYRIKKHSSHATPRKIYSPQLFTTLDTVAAKNLTMTPPLLLYEVPSTPIYKSFLVTSGPHLAEVKFVNPAEFSHDFLPLKGPGAGILEGFLASLPSIGRSHMFSSSLICSEEAEAARASKSWHIES